MFFAQTSTTKSTSWSVWLLSFSLFSSHLEVNTCFTFDPVFFILATASSTLGPNSHHLGQPSCPELPPRINRSPQAASHLSPTVLLNYKSPIVICCAQLLEPTNKWASHAFGKMSLGWKVAETDLEFLFPLWDLRVASWTSTFTFWEYSPTHSLTTAATHFRRT